MMWVKGIEKWKRKRKRVSRQPHKFKVDDMVTVSGIADSVFQVRQCLYDSCGYSIYLFYGYFGEPVMEDLISLKED